MPINPVPSSLSIPDLRVYVVLPPGILGRDRTPIMLRVSAADLQRGDIEVHHGAASKAATISLSQCVAIMRGGELQDDAGNVLFEGDIVRLGPDGAERAIVCYGPWHNRRNGAAQAEGHGWHLRVYIRQGPAGYEETRRIMPNTEEETHVAGHVFQESEQAVALPAFREATGKALDLDVTV